MGVQPGFVHARSDLDDGTHGADAENSLGWESGGNLPCRMKQSESDAPTASTSISACPSPTSGTGTSAKARVSGGPNSLT